MSKISFRKVDVDGFNIFCREAGPKNAPAILLLHGFPSASHMFRDLIPLLADRFRVVAPDLPASASLTCRTAASSHTPLTMSRGSSTGSPR